MVRTIMLPGSLPCCIRQAAVWLTWHAAMLTTVSNSVAPLMSLSAAGLSGRGAGLSPSFEVLMRCRSASLRAFVFLSPAAQVLWWSVGGPLLSWSSKRPCRGVRFCGPVCATADM